MHSVLRCHSLVHRYLLNPTPPCQWGHPHQDPQYSSKWVQWVLHPLDLITVVCKVYYLDAHRHSVLCVIVSTGWASLGEAAPLRYLLLAVQYNANFGVSCIAWL